MTDDYYVAHPSPEPDPLINNPYLNREKCLLCQRDRNEDDKSDSEGELMTGIASWQLGFCFHTDFALEMRIA